MNLIVLLLIGLCAAAVLALAIALVAQSRKNKPTSPTATTSSVVIIGRATISAEQLETLLSWNRKGHDSLIAAFLQQHNITQAEFQAFMRSRG